MHSCHTCKDSACPQRIPRRDFLAFTGAAGVAAAATHLGVWDVTRALAAAEPSTLAKPTVRVVFMRPEEPVMVSWPGGNCDVAAQQALFTKVLTEAAGPLGIGLDIQAKPLNKPEEVTGLLAEIEKAPPDGLIVCAMELTLWDLVNQIVEKRGDTPTIVYSNLSAFTSHLQCGRNTKKTFVAATQDADWLATGLRALATIPRMKQTRILFVAGNEAKDTPVPGLGTVFHWIPRQRFEEEFQQVAASDEVRALADTVAKGAAKIIEPSAAEMIESAKNYFVCRRLMEREGCHGIAIDCLGWKNPVCVAFSRLRDEGIVAACEQDPSGTAGMLLVHLLTQRPCFQQDPSPNTINNTLIGAHCTSPTKLEGFHQPYQAPYLLRNYHTRTGVAPQVLWPEGKPVTCLQLFLDPLSIVVGTGQVVSNIAQPPSGCCRTSVEISLAGVADTRDVKGFHQHFVLGNIESELKVYGKLADIPVTPIG
jgi:hypothetical protein